MATLQTSDIVFYYTATGASGTSNSLSLGSTINANTITDNTANNIFSDVTGDQSASGIQQYRCIAVKDANGSGAAMLNAKVYISGYVRATANYDTMYFAIQNPTGGTNPVQTITSDTTAPNANLFITAIGNTVAWTAEGAPSATLSFGTVAAAQWMGIWLQRSVPVSAAAFSNRAVTITVACETTGSPRHAVVKEFVVNTSDFLSGMNSNAISPK
jgi:hypothetical protein